MGVLVIGGRTFDCPLFFGDNPDRRCVSCGEPLTGRRTRWCGDECSERWALNHYWTNAREAALQRDGVCVRCGTDSTWPEGAAFRRLLEYFFPRPLLRDFGDIRDGPATRAWWEACKTWHAADRITMKEQRNHALEVNHIVPILGRHGEAGCHHHLDGLETLCHRCHVAETATQRAAGAFAR